MTSTCSAGSGAGSRPPQPTATRPAARDLVRVAVAAETARAWADICNAGNQMAAMEQVIAAQRGDLALNRRIVQQGDCPLSEAESVRERLRQAAPACRKFRPASVMPLSVWPA
jgi:hypothetical protein